MDDIDELMMLSLRAMASELRAEAFEKYIKMLGSIVLTEAEIVYFVEQWSKTYPIDYFVVMAANILINVDSGMK